MSPKKITILVHQHQKLNGMIDMDSDDFEFVYSQPNIFMHGVQSNLEDDEKNRELLNRCKIIVDEVRKINELMLKN